MIDPLAEMKNLNLVWIPGNIYTAEDVKWWRWSYNFWWSDCSDYDAIACGYVGPWFLGLSTVDAQINVPGNTKFLTKTLFLTYLYHDKEADEILWPNDYQSGWISAPSCYCDAQYVLQTAPSYKPEMATGTNRVYMVTEHYNETSDIYQIVYKATITDIDTLLGTIGGGPKDFDKYADIEVWPWQMYLVDGTDPDISADGSNVCVVCMNKNICGDWDIICAYSKDDGENWNYSYIAGEHPVDEKYPAVYVSGKHVYCCYVKSGNLYLAVSEDSGATWCEPFKINDIDGSVVEEAGTVDLVDAGVIWTDSRNGNKDIYFDTLNQPPDKPTISGKTNGKAGNSYSYSATTTDPDGDQVNYWFDWDDGTNSGWVGPYDSGQTASKSHVWSAQGSYSIKVKAKDTNGAESDWGTFSVSMPRNKPYRYTPFLQFLQNFLQNHPLIYQLLQQLLNL